MRVSSKSRAILRSFIVRVLRPVSVGPMISRSDFHTKLTQTISLFRGGPNVQLPSSTSFVRDETSVIFITKFLTTDLDVKSPPAAPDVQDLRRRFRVHLSTTKHPMTIYAKLKSAGELSKETCHALLSNPNLQSYDDINVVAIETKIPASYVIAKLIRTRNQSEDALATWIKKVPSVKSLWSFVGELYYAYHSTKMNLVRHSDRKRSLQQCQIDLSAHMLYTLRMKGIDGGYELWKKWVNNKPQDAEISITRKKDVLRLSSVQILQRASKESDKNQIIAEILEWDNTVLQISPPGRRRTLILQFMEQFTSTSSTSRHVTAAAVLQQSHDVLEPNEIAGHSERVLSDWISHIRKSKSAHGEGKSAYRFYRFLSWALEECSSADLHARGRLESFKTQLEELKNTQRHQQSGPVLHVYAKSGG